MAFDVITESLAFLCNADFRRMKSIKEDLEEDNLNKRDLYLNMQTLVIYIQGY